MVQTEFAVVVPSEKIDIFLKKLGSICTKYSCIETHTIAKMINYDKLIVQIKLQATQYTFFRNNRFEDIYNEIVCWDV